MVRIVRARLPAGGCMAGSSHVGRRSRFPSRRRASAAVLSLACAGRGRRCLRSITPGSSCGFAAAQHRCQGPELRLDVHLPVRPHDRRGLRAGGTGARRRSARRRRVEPRRRPWQRRDRQDGGGLDRRLERERQPGDRAALHGLHMPYAPGQYVGSRLPQRPVRDRPVPRRHLSDPLAATPASDAGRRDPVRPGRPCRLRGAGIDRSPTTWPTTCG